VNMPVAATSGFRTVDIRFSTTVQFSADAASQSQCGNSWSVYLMKYKSPTAEDAVQSFQMAVPSGSMVPLYFPSSVLQPGDYVRVKVSADTNPVPACVAFSDSYLLIAANGYGWFPQWLQLYTEMVGFCCRPCADSRCELCPTSPYVRSSPFCLPHFCAQLDMHTLLRHVSVDLVRHLRHALRFCLPLRALLLHDGIFSELSGVLPCVQPQNVSGCLPHERCLS
jgi:hypothetical protein